MNPQKLLERIGRGQINNVRFSDLTSLVEALGFELDRTRGSHRIYRHPRTTKKLNLQPLKNGDAKPYQVRQAASMIEQYSLELED